MRGCASGLRAFLLLPVAISVLLAGECGSGKSERGIGRGGADGGSGDGACVRRIR